MFRFTQIGSRARWMEKVLYWESEMQMPTKNESRAVVIRVAQQTAGATGVKTDTFPRSAAKNRPLSGSAASDLRLMSARARPSLQKILHLANQVLLLRQIACRFECRWNSHTHNTGSSVPCKVESWISLA
jgi:hypothetical protein